jgi:hypothetical protein
MDNLTNCITTAQTQPAAGCAILQGGCVGVAWVWGLVAQAPVI